MDDEAVGLATEEVGEPGMIGGNSLDSTPQTGVSIVLWIELK
jgi:hypothetical protein